MGDQDRSEQNIHVLVAALSLSPVTESLENYKRPFLPSSYLQPYSLQSNVWSGMDDDDKQDSDTDSHLSLDLWQWTQPCES